MKILKRIEISGKPLYSFISGMFYTDRPEFDLKSDVSVPYPYSSYYKFKIPPIENNGKLYKSLIYCKIPIIIIQMENYYHLIEFQPVVEKDGNEIVPFISMESKNGKIEINFAVPESYNIERKDNVWLGIGKKEIIHNKIPEFEAKMTKVDGFWMDSINKIIANELGEPKIASNKINIIINNLKQALWRAWDNSSGTFGQVPWKDTPGFAIDKYTWSLTSYEATRLLYFYKYWLKTNDEDYQYWLKKMRKFFDNENIMLTPKKGNGKIMYELTMIGRNGIRGDCYLDFGYAGYPGGQATIALNFLKYYSLKKENNEDDSEILEKSKQLLEYIISTQNIDGSWQTCVKQTTEIPVRIDSLEDTKTTGGTGECIRALLAGYKITKNEEYLRSALVGLKYLTAKKENGYSCFGLNSLRDIGKNEVEGISAIYITHAFLDAYQHLNDEQYKKQAEIWASYLLTWFYTWESKNFKPRGIIHPISESITPRISPYETVLSIELFVRMFKTTKNIFWKTLAIKTYSRVLDFVEKDGGLCECHFPDWLDGMSTVPMEQTFATAELLNASHIMSDLLNTEISIEKQTLPEISSEGLEYTTGRNILSISNKEKKLLSFDFENFEFVSDDTKINISFWSPYSKRNIVRAEVKSYIMSGFGRMISGIRDMPLAVTGIIGPEILNEPKIHNFSSISKTNYSIEKISDSPLAFKFMTKTLLHSINGVVKFGLNDGKMTVLFTPLKIEVLKYGLKTNQVLYPVITGDKEIRMLNYENKKAFNTDSLIAYDISLDTNWTHRGLWKKKFGFVINV
jgi:hypothetical protein